MKKRSINIILPAAIFAASMTILSGCGDSSDSTASTTEKETSQDSEVVTETEETDEETDDETTGETANDMIIGYVNTVDEETVELTEYELTSDETDYLTVDVESLILSENTTTLADPENYTIFKVLDGEEEEASLDELVSGTIVAIVEESDSAGKIVILKQDTEEVVSDTTMEYTVAEITEISEEQMLSMSIYTLKTDYADYIAEDYETIDLDFYEDTFEEVQYEIPEDANLWIVEDGELLETDVSGMSVGDMLLYYTAEDGSDTVLLYPADALAEDE